MPLMPLVSRGGDVGAPGGWTGGVCPRLARPPHLGDLTDEQSDLWDSIKFFRFRDGPLSIQCDENIQVGELSGP